MTDHPQPAVAPAPPQDSSPLPGIVMAAIILAGGASRRMGQAKCLLSLGDLTLAEWTVQRLAPQVSTLALNANEPEASRLRRHLTCPILPDPLPDRPGPLAGLLAGLRWAETSFPASKWLITVPIDCPFFPLDLVKRLSDATEQGAGAAFASSGGRGHPVFGLWPIAAAQNLADYLAGGERRVMGWIEGLRGEGWQVARVDWPTSPHDFSRTKATDDPFFNINFPADLDLARERLRGEDNQREELQRGGRGSSSTSKLT